MWLAGHATAEGHATARAYQQLGNAVCPPVIRAIGEVVIGLLERARRGARAGEEAEAGGEVEVKAEVREGAQARQGEQPSGAQDNVIFPSASTFDTTLRSASLLASSPCVLDVSRDVIHNFARGSFGCVEAALLAGMGREATAQVLYLAAEPVLAV